MPGVTSAPKLQPIETRIVMLQSGFRAPMGVKVYGPDLETIESFGLELERLLKQVPSVQPAASSPTASSASPISRSTSTARRSPATACASPTCRRSSRSPSVASR